MIYRTASLLLFFHLAGGLKTEECIFTNDCYNLPKCKVLEDSTCVCKFGACTIVDPPESEEGEECSYFTDCPCSDDPENCFCKNGYCKNERWECHESSDCGSLAKCEGKNCTCTYDDLCEHDCDTDSDCLNEKFNCADPEYPDFTCRCEANLCQFVSVGGSKECESLADCVGLEQCDSYSPCLCNDGECQAPDFVYSDWYQEHQDRNCRNDQDCDNIYACQFGRCTCEDLVLLSEDAEDEWGICAGKQEYIQE